MGGMLVLEFAYFGKDYVKSIIPIATSARYSAWGISWGEAQRQSIYSDPKYSDGYYPFDDPPATGLGAARMSALLTYRSRDSFESRFGRNIPDPTKRLNINGQQRPGTPVNKHWEIHNDGHRLKGSPRGSRNASLERIPSVTKHQAAQNSDLEYLSTFGNTPVMTPVDSSHNVARRSTPHYFSAQSYLRYQGEKFIKRFDANCYIAITRKLDTHDLSRNRTLFTTSYTDAEAVSALHAALAQIEQPTLVLGIQSDGLFTFAEQQELAAHIPNATLKTIDSPDGHDAFLLEFEQVNKHLLEFMNQVLPDIMSRTPNAEETEKQSNDGFGATKTSTFGEAEVGEITAW
jgi:homoserine O-acetyltransferase/O-succinyltransferase